MGGVRTQLLRVLGTPMLSELDLICCGHGGTSLALVRNLPFSEGITDVGPGVQQDEIPWSGNEGYGKNLTIQMGRCPVRSM
jgi:hypothetical protein